MKKILIATALAGAAVGAFASLSFAAPLPARLDSVSSTNIVAADYRCGPHRHFIRGFQDRYGRWIPSRCVMEVPPPPPGYYR